MKTMRYEHFKTSPFISSRVVKDKKEADRRTLRTLVEAVAKIATCVSVNIVVIVGYMLDVLSLSGCLMTLAINLIWFGLPDLIAYITESILKLEHKHTYR